jgi:hypothetical protein
MHLVLFCHGQAPGSGADANPPHCRFCDQLEEPLPRSFLALTPSVIPQAPSNQFPLLAQQLPPTRTRRWHARLTSDTETRLGPIRVRDWTTVAKMPYVVPCFASLLVSRIRPELSPYLGSAQGCRTLFARVHLPFTPMSQQLSPRLDSTPNAHLSMCAGPLPETRHDRRFAAHLFSFQRRAPTVLATINAFGVAPLASMSSPVHAGRPASADCRPEKDFLFPSQTRSISFLTPRHRLISPERPPSWSSLLPQSPLVKMPCFHRQGRLPPTVIRRIDRLMPKSISQSRRASWQVAPPLRQ